VLESVSLEPEAYGVFATPRPAVRAATCAINTCCNAII
jgi:hypothetical protein